MLLTRSKNFHFSASCFLLLLLLPTFSFSQLLDKKPFWIETTPVRFNPEAVQQQKIKKIIVNFQDKLDDFPIEDKGLHDVYEFDTRGLVTRFSHLSIKSREVIEVKVPAVYNKNGRRISPAYIRDEYVYTYDTAYVWFKYDELNHLIMKRTNQGDFFFTWYYDYNQNGFLIKQTYCKETNKNTDKHQFELAVQTIISSEAFDYSFQTATQMKKVFLNDEGKEYRNAIVNFSRFYIEENHSFTVGFVKYYNLYTFNEKGLPLETKSTTNTNGDISHRTLFEYNEKGILTAEKKYRDTTHTNNITWMYDEKSQLIKAQLDRDFQKKRIGIVKFSYEYY